MGAGCEETNSRPLTQGTDATNAAKCSSSVVISPKDSMGLTRRWLVYNRLMLP